MQVYTASPAAVYTGIGNAFSRISSTEGARTLWRGVASVIAGAGPAHAVYFGTYEVVKELAGGNRAGHQFAATCELTSIHYAEVDAHTLASAIAGAAATITSDALMNPFDGTYSTPL